MHVTSPSVGATIVRLQPIQYGRDRADGCRDSLITAMSVPASMAATVPPEICSVPLSYTSNSLSHTGSSKPNRASQPVSRVSPNTWADVSTSGARSAAVLFTKVPVPRYIPLRIRRHVPRLCLSSPVRHAAATSQLFEEPKVAVLLPLPKAWPMSRKPQLAHATRKRGAGASGPV